MSPNKIDRRDFMTNSIVVAGTSAIFASDAVVAIFEEIMGTHGSDTGTIFTGVSIQGKKLSVG